jgi:hypothetical protein
MARSKFTHSGVVAVTEGEVENSTRMVDGGGASQWRPQVTELGYKRSKLGVKWELGVQRNGTVRSAGRRRGTKGRRRISKEGAINGFGVCLFGLFISGRIMASTPAGRIGKERLQAGLTQSRVAQQKVITGVANIDWQAKNDALVTSQNTYKQLVHLQTATLDQVVRLANIKLDEWGSGWVKMMDLTYTGK